MATKNSVAKINWANIVFMTDRKLGADAMLQNYTKLIEFGQFLH